MGREGEDFYRLPSPKSQVVKFARVLCRKCNNARSQPFDEAYDIYARYIQSNLTPLSRASKIDWRHIYGEEWEVQARALGGYAVKNFGCWIAQNGFAPPPALATFLSGGELLEVRLMLARQQSASLAFRAMRLGGGPDVDRGVGVLGAVGRIDIDGTRLVTYEQDSYIAHICMRFNWADSSGQGNLFWQAPVIPLEIMPASSKQWLIAGRLGARTLWRRARRADKSSRAASRDQQ